MPATIRVMSWNIKQFGESTLTGVANSFAGDKLTADQACIDYIKTIIVQKEIKIVALLEVTGSQCDHLISFFKPALPGWKFAYTSPQRHKTKHERYIVMWDENPNSGIVGLNENPANNPSASWLYRIFDDNTMAAFFKSIGWENNRVKQIQCFNTLATSGYITELEKVRQLEKDAVATKKRKRIEFDENSDDDDGDEDGPFLPSSKEKRVAVPGGSDNSSGGIVMTKKNYEPLPDDQGVLSFSYLVDGARWNILNSVAGSTLELKDGSGNPVDLGLTALQLQMLKNVLVMTDLIGFPDKTSRSPFIVNFILSDNSGKNYPLMIAAMHAPNPTDNNKDQFDKTVTKMKYAAINNLSMCTPFEKVDNFLLMGDFNVTNDEAAAPAKAIEYKKCDPAREKLAYGFWPMKPILLAKPFTNIINAPINAKSLFDTIPPPVESKTSLQTNKKVFLNLAPTNFSDNTFEYLSEAYDKFFFKGIPAQVKAGIPQVVDLVAITDQSGAAKDQSPYNPTIAASAMSLYKTKLNIAKIEKWTEKTLGGKAWTKFQRKMLPDKYVTMEPVAKRAKIAEIAATEKHEAVENLATIINNSSRLLREINDKPEMTVPTKRIYAFMAYSKLSDHLPIMVELNIGVLPSIPLT